EAGAGSVCTEDRDTKAISCSPGLKAGAGSTADIGWNTKVTAKVGCEGVYCKEFFASLLVAVTPHPRITIVPINCKLSTNRDETGCIAEVRLTTDPMPFGQQH
ncbi:MAG: hypothetical protein ACXVCY_16080, partial [Pseudobdellovibrionaceae bacterium]